MVNANRVLQLVVGLLEVFGQLKKLFLLFQEKIVLFFKACLEFLL